MSRNQDNIFTNSHTLSPSNQDLQRKTGDSNIFRVNYALDGKFSTRSSKMSCVDNADEISYSWLRKMERFWIDNIQYVAEKPLGFLKSEVERIKQDLIKFEEKLQKLEKIRPYFRDDQDDLRKQAFLLNIFNFLVLHKFALLLLNGPEAFKMLKTYGMWQQLLISC